MTDDNKLFKDVKEIQLIGPMDFNKGLVDLAMCTIVVDGGLNHNLKFNSTHISIGDNDSSKEHSVDIEHPKKKDFSDLKLALNLIKDSKVLKKVNLLGFLNGRKDHELGNLFELITFLKHKSNTIANFENEILILSKGKYTFFSEGTFSLFSLIDQEITITGQCEYHLDQQKIKALSTKGLSNIAHGKVELKINSELICYFDNGFNINLEN